MRNTNSRVSVVGTPHIVLRDKTGAVIADFHVPNRVVTGGKGFIASRMTGTPTPMSHMAIGSGTTVAADGNTTLEAELGRAVIVSATTVDAVTTYTATFAMGVGTGAVTEAGVFNASTGGTMLCRTTFPVVNKGADDTMSITWTITIQ